LKHARHSESWVPTGTIITIIDFNFLSTHQQSYKNSP